MTSSIKWTEETTQDRGNSPSAERCWEVRWAEDWDVTPGWAAYSSLVGSGASLWAQKTDGNVMRSEWVTGKWRQWASPSLKKFGLWDTVRRERVAAGGSRAKSTLLCIAFMILNVDGRDVIKWKNLKMGAGEWSIQWGPWGSCAQKGD